MLLNVLNVKSENKVAQNDPAEFYRRPAATECKNICISPTFLCVCPQNLSLKLNFYIWKKAYYSLFFLTFNAKITMKYSTSQAIFYICPLMIMQMNTNVIQGKCVTQ